MITELAEVTKNVIVSKINKDKQQIGQGIFFLGLKTVLGVLTLVFLVIALFLWLEGSLNSAPIAALVVAAISVLVAIVVDAIQKQMKKNYYRHSDDWLHVLEPLLVAFIDGVAHEEKDKKKHNNDNIADKAA